MIHYAVPNMPALVGHTSTSGSRRRRSRMSLLVEKGVERRWPGKGLAKA